MRIHIETASWSEHELLDSGKGLKLERFGPNLVIRSEPKAWWRPALPDSEWKKAVGTFTTEGRDAAWQFSRTPLREWKMKRGPLVFEARFTENSKHLGVFPEQAPHWDTILAKGPLLKAPDGGKPRLLNLFGYTGAATLTAAQAGFAVTHVDASKPAVAWGRRNQELSGMTNLPIRWVLEDALKYVRREKTRGSFYEAILLDPPSFGRGPNGEVWKCEERIGELMDACREILSERAGLLLLTLYSLEASSIMAGNIMAQAARGLGGQIAIGELALRHTHGDRLLPLSLFARWEK